ncbi:unnamed protein product [Calicophoron daubneyi]|uniref:Uncharacterized protein n=1 Tax=Calicophoron daubneyi TaxID=300641 RepID=A0AAV2TUK1_CALDB
MRHFEASVQSDVSDLLEKIAAFEIDVINEPSIPTDSFVFQKQASSAPGFIHPELVHLRALEETMDKTVNGFSQLEERLEKLKKEDKFILLPPDQQNNLVSSLVAIDSHICDAGEFLRTFSVKKQLRDSVADAVDGVQRIISFRDEYISQINRLRLARECVEKMDF